ncbi:hypothetical protein [Clostridium sp. UBA1056]|uniref:hypothetical protein n=1 Tax=unclassified Clostridium TaxID=2614128 RepID=UPI0032176991
MEDRFLNSEDIDYILEQFYEIPIHQIANNLECSIAKVTRELRKRGKIQEIIPCELNYILDNKDKIPLEELRKELGLSNTQFSQISSRYDIGKKIKNVNEYTEEEVIKQTRYLLEEKLKLTINDKLVSKINGETIIDAGGYHLVNYANHKKKEHKIYKYFSSVAYLFHLVYPNKFRPYQFMHSANTKDYFTVKVYLGELIIIMEDKMKLNLENIEALANCSGFLRNSDLQFYGLGAYVYKRLFNSKKEMIRQLLVHLDKNKKNTHQNTQKLAKRLYEEGVNPNRCYCKDCNNSQIEIHHIYFKKFADIVNFDIDSVFNLIPLCTEHHSMVKNMDVELLDLKNKENWKMDVINYLNNLKDNIV